MSPTISMASWYIPVHRIITLGIMCVALSFSRTCRYVSVCARACVRVCIYVCVCARERVYAKLSNGSLQCTLPIRRHVSYEVHDAKSNV